jgi:hypothetical protein
MLCPDRNDLIGDRLGDELYRFKRIVVRRHRIVDKIGVAVGINNRADRNMQAAAFGDRNVFLDGIDDENDCRDFFEVADPGRARSSFSLRLRSRTRSFFGSASNVPSASMDSIFSSLLTLWRMVAKFVSMPPSHRSVT